MPKRARRGRIVLLQDDGSAADGFSQRVVIPAHGISVDGRADGQTFTEGIRLFSAKKP